MAKKSTKRKEKVDRQGKPDPDRRSTTPPPEATNHDHPSPPGAVDTAPGAGIVEGADTSTHDRGPGRDAPDARATAPGAQRPGTTEGRAASAARGGGRSGLSRSEAPSEQGQTAYASATGDAGAPSPGSSGIRATSDPNFTARRADEEGTPSPEALAEQAASRGKENLGE
jgi:hypothetical protein